jgi:hypothetical protein
MIANDPTEAVRSEELPGFLERHFEILERKEIGGTILQHMLYDVVQHFRFNEPRERALVEILCAIEAMLVDNRRVPCDYVILAARKRGAHVIRANRPLPPRPREADDVGEDPLARLGGSPARPLPRGSARRHAGTPAEWRTALRCLRLALLAQQPVRANLHRESKFLSLRERWRARRVDPWTWIRHRLPEDDAIDCLLRTAATLAAREAL